MLIDDIKTVLSTLESNIFLHTLPDAPDNVCVIQATGGYLPKRIIDGSATIEQPTFMVIIRDVSYAAGDARITAVRDKLDGYCDSTYSAIFRQSNILPLGKDEKGRSRFSVNFWAKYKRSV